MLLHEYDRNVHSHLHVAVTTLFMSTYLQCCGYVHAHIDAFEALHVTDSASMSTSVFNSTTTFLHALEYGRLPLRHGPVVWCTGLLTALH